MHLASCKKLREVWLTFNRLVAASHRQTPLTHALIFHAQEPDGSLLPQGLSALHLITWKLLIYHLTMVDRENRRFNHKHVWDHSLRRFEVRASALAHKVYRQSVANRGKGLKLHEPDADNRKLAPLAHINEFGHITYCDSLQAEFKRTRP